jgi:multidrug efflux pump subunit AcrA (membrane-fusion protein)
VLFIGALGLGVWRHDQQHYQVMHIAEQQADFVPSVRVERVTQRLGTQHVTLPATTLGFVDANIYARASGYVLKRYVDIGDHVKTGQPLAEITAPEVEDQVAQKSEQLAGGSGDATRERSSACFDRCHQQAHCHSGQ